MSNNVKLKPIAFMVMPFRKRSLSTALTNGVSYIDCDSLWDKAFRPALEELGFLPVRADSEVGNVILKDMLERLALADLVLADLTFPNGNVYYEVGLRHVAKETHCVLIAAEGSSQLFDLDQVRIDRYPLDDGDIPDPLAKEIRQHLLDVIPKKMHSRTPYHELVRGIEETSVFREQIEKISNFQAKVQATRFIKEKKSRQSAVDELCDQYSGTALEIPEVALELLELVRDTLGWEKLHKYIDSLPKAIRDRPFTQEQQLLAQSKQGEHHVAITGLDKLIKLNGDSPERRGLIGGCYKKLWREARVKRGVQEPPGLEELGLLDSAIESYTLGMELNYNEYYCMCNIPLLLRSRGKPDDIENAKFLDTLVVRICERKINLNEADEWVRPTLLGAAFRAECVQKVRDLALEVAREGAAVWKLETTFRDIDDAIEMVAEQDIKDALQAARIQLKNLIKAGD